MDKKELLNNLITLTNQLKEHEKKFKERFKSNSYWASYSIASLNILCSQIKEKSFKDYTGDYVADTSLVLLKEQLLMIQEMTPGWKYDDVASTIKRILDLKIMYFNPMLYA